MSPYNFNGDDFNADPLRFLFSASECRAPRAQPYAFNCYQEYLLGIFLVRAAVKQYRKESTARGYSRSTFSADSVDRFRAIRKVTVP